MILAAVDIIFIFIYTLSNCYYSMHVYVLYDLIKQKPLNIGVFQWINCIH